MGDIQNMPENNSNPVLTEEQKKDKELTGVFIPADNKPADDKTVFIQPSEIIGKDRLNVYDFFINAILENPKKSKRELMLSAIGDYEKTIVAADVLTSVLNSVCNADKESGLLVPSYKGCPAIVRQYLTDEELKTLKENQLLEDSETYSIILKGDGNELRRVVFSKRIRLNNGMVSRIDNFTGDGKFNFAAKFFSIISPRHLINDVRREEIDRQNIITRQIRDVIMSYVSENLSIVAMETTIIKMWDTLDEDSKTTLIKACAKDVYTFLKKSDSIHAAESKCIGDICSVLRVKYADAVKLRKIADGLNKENNSEQTTE